MDVPWRHHSHALQETAGTHTTLLPALNHGHNIPLLWTVYSFTTLQPLCCSQGTPSAAQHLSRQNPSPVDAVARREDRTEVETHCDDLWTFNFDVGTRTTGDFDANVEEAIVRGNIFQAWRRLASF